MRAVRSEKTEKARWGKSEREKEGKCPKECRKVRKKGYYRLERSGWREAVGERSKKTHIREKSKAKVRRMPKRVKTKWMAQ